MIRSPARGGGAFVPNLRWPPDDSQPASQPATTGTGEFEKESPNEESPADPIAARVPPTLNPEPASQPIVHRQAEYLQEQTPVDPTGADPTSASPTAAENASAGGNEPSRPWMPLMATMALLVMSAALNAYLAWVARDFYRRYRDLALDSRQAGAAS